MPAENEADDRLELLACVLSAAERRIRLRRLVHRGISVRISIAVKVEAPYIEAGLAQSIAPRITVEPVRDRER